MFKYCVNKFFFILLFLYTNSAFAEDYQSTVITFGSMTPFTIEPHYLNLDNDNQLDAVSWINIKTDAGNDYRLQLKLSTQSQPKIIQLIDQDSDISIVPIRLMIEGNVLIVSYLENGQAAIERHLKLRLDKHLNKIQIIGYDDRYALEGSFFANWARSFNLITGDSTAQYYANDWSETSIHASKKHDDLQPMYLDEVIDNVRLIDRKLDNTMGIAKLLSIKI